MASINTLPEELLSYIFTMGSQLRSDIWGERDKWGRPVNFVSQTPFLSPITHARRRKPFIEQVALVCSRWKEIVDLGSNGHMWITTAHLDVNPDYVQQHQDPTTQLGLFRKILNSSYGSDLDIALSFADHEPNVSATWPWDPSIVLARLFLHGMAMIVSYSRQWRCLSIRVSQWEMMVFLTVILRQATFTPSLAWVSINEGTWADPRRPPPLPSINMDTLLGLYLDSYPARFERTVLSTHSLVHIGLSAVTLSDFLELPPSSVQSLNITGITLDDDNRWSHAVRTLKRSHELRKLQLETSYNEGIPNLSFDSVGGHIPLDHLRQLKLMMDVLNARNLMLACHLPRLEELDIQFRGEVSVVIALKLDMVHISLPSLRILTAGSMEIHEAQMLSMLHTPRLDILDVQFYAPPEGDYYTRDSFDMPLLAHLRSRLGASSRISSLPTRLLTLILSQWNLEDVERLVIEKGYPADIEVFPDDKDFSKTKLEMPNLAMLELVGQNIELENHFLNYVHVPRLETLYFVRMGKDPRKESLQVWESFCLRHADVFRNLKDLRVDLPDYPTPTTNQDEDGDDKDKDNNAPTVSDLDQQHRQQLRNPLSHFPRLESLIIDVVSDWQGGVEWLTASGSSEDLPLVNLRTLKVKLHNMPLSPFWDPPLSANQQPAKRHLHTKESLIVAVKMIITFRESKGKPLKQAIVACMEEDVDVLNPIKTEEAQDGSSETIEKTV